MANGTEQIAHVKVTTRYRRYPGEFHYVDGEMETGEDVTMKNGETWFHPYSGGAPRRVAAS